MLHRELVLEAKDCNDNVRILGIDLAELSDLLGELETATFATLVCC